MTGVAMHTDTTQREKPTGSANYPAGHTDSGSISGAAMRIKAGLICWSSWLATVLRGLA